MKNYISTVTSSIVKERPAIEGLYIENFDGLRAAAALMVMAMHVKTIPTFAGGAAGVWIFFALSGYLLYSSFLRFSREINASVIFSYFTRRVFRIVPLYLFFAFVYAYLFKGWSLEGKNIFFLVQLFFLKGVLHLWTVRVEMILYLLLPGIILILSFFKNTIYRSLVLVASSILSVFAFHKYGFSLIDTKDHLAIFMLGMAAVHLKEYIPRKVAPVIAYSSFVLILLLSTFSPFTLPLRELFGVLSREDMYFNAHVFYPLCFLLLASLSRFHSRFWGNKWLRIVGVCGFGFYLWHPLIIELVRRWEIDWWALNQFLAYFLSLAISIITYIAIEKPGIQVGRILSKWILSNKKVFLSVRPWVICVVLLMAFLSFRQTYIIGTKIDFKITIWASNDTEVRVYLSQNGRFTEDNSVGVEVIGEKWQTVTMSFKDRPFDKIRFDPGTNAGKYKVKEFSVFLPWFKREVSLQLDSFKSVQDLELNEMQDDYWLIKPVESAKDPILVYMQDIPGKIINTRNILISVFVGGSLLLFCLFTVLNRVRVGICSED